jgi:hypothetical protein
MGKDLSGNEKGQSGIISALSSQVDLAGRNSKLLMLDLKRLMSLFK